METAWLKAKNILCIRPDNMGDVLMSSPAIRALKSDGRKITLLTSSMGSGIARYIPEIDEIIEYNLPWIKATENIQGPELLDLVQKIKAYNFEAAIVFTTYSQNPLPSAMITFLAGIPLRASYCRENPYALLTNWVPDKEPLHDIQHEVRRQIQLVKSVGYKVTDDDIQIQISENEMAQTKEELAQHGVTLGQPWIIIHPGVSEKKRQVDAKLFIEAGRKIISEKGIQIIVTGGKDEKEVAHAITQGIGRDAVSLAGELSLSEFIGTIKLATLVLSVNTGTIHIASAFKKKTVVLYAATNPQHTPWKTPGKVLLFDVPPQDRSKNEILKFSYNTHFNRHIQMIQVQDIVNAVNETLHTEVSMPEVIKL